MTMQKRRQGLVMTKARESVERVSQADVQHDAAQKSRAAARNDLKGLPFPPWERETSEWQSVVSFSISS